MEQSLIEQAESGARVCEACGYDLRAQVVARCPECGTVFDPTEAPTPPIPWARHAAYDRWGAYWATVAWALLGPRAAGRAVASAAAYLDSSSAEFRRLLVRQAIACAALFAVLATLRAFGDLRAIGPSLVTAAMLFPGIALFLSTATQTHSLPSAWYSRPMLADHAEALQNYALAPLALMPVPAIVEAVALWCRLTNQPNVDRHIHQAAVASLAAIMLTCWALTLVMMSGSGIWRSADVIRAGLRILVRWVVLAVCVAMLTFVLGACVVFPWNAFSR